MLSSLVLIAALAGQPPLLEPTRDHVAMLEINHLFDENAKPVFIQVIFWDWNSTCERYEIVDWRIIKHRSPVPAYNPTLGRWEAVWFDGPVLRRVTALSCRETATQVDPEIYDRQFLPKDDRKLLSPAPGRFHEALRRTYSVLREPAGRLPE